VRLVAAIALALTALAGSASAAPAIADVSTTASASSALVRWTTPIPSQGRVAFGVGGLDLFTAREPAATTSHHLELPDLETATT
jgi:hypothetical protein